jgi:hypothetical protein
VQNRNRTGLIFLALCTTGLLGLSLPSTSFAWASLDENTLPDKAAKIEQFIPAGWQLENKIRGDMDGDHVSDTVLQLVERAKSDSSTKVAPTANVQTAKTKEEPRQRALILLLKKSSGYEKKGFSNRLLLCTTCGDTPLSRNGANIKITIEKGILEIKQAMGNKEPSTTDVGFMRDPVSKNFELVYIVTETTKKDSGEHERTITDYLRGERTVETWKVVAGHDTNKASRKFRARTARFTLDTLGIDKI